MKTDLQHIDLPIIEVLPEICWELKNNNRLIIHAPPGAGKSTVVPLALLDELWLEGKKIIMLEPRRLAAKSIAVRMADLLGEQVGHTIGYRIRFESRISDKTKIEVVTEGILTRMLQSDNALEGVGAVIFDEFHERSIFADVSLALSLESQSILRPDLRLLIMSATLDIPDLQEKLQAPLVQSLGRQYPIEVSYADRHDVRAIPEMVAQTVMEAFEEHKEGDILAFLPGEAEIKRCEVILNHHLKEVAVLPLYGQLPYKRQQLALRPHPDGLRKVVLATAIAETSLTIEGVRIVVDCGFERSAQFDTRSGLPRLMTSEITLDAAQQRAGRAGRLGPGYCVRLWSKGKHHQLVKHRKPEIENADVTSLVLDLAAWGTSNPDDLLWLTPPPKGAVFQAKEV
ncbi:MAG: ATP-dependent helicase HrpB, partial [Bacteroidales bacterium]|nr:ATP-dependent helicase HrpB [Bacteroidales bacterium]